MNVLYLCCEDVLHGQHIHFGVNSKGSFDLCSDQQGSTDLCELVDLASGREGALEGHVARGASCAEERFLVVGSKHSILDGYPDEAVCLSVPLRESERDNCSNEMKKDLHCFRSQGGND